MKYPFNAITGNSYSEANTLQLLQAGYSSPEFATYNQWKSADRQVKAGTKGTKLQNQRVSFVNLYTLAKPC